MIRTMLSRMATAMLVKVMGVTNDGGVSPVGFVDIMPLVNMVDGDGNATPHGTIFSCPYMRIQGGKNAVILDPEQGDIGIAVFASRDLSSVIANKDQANPGSDRRYSYADGLYLGGALNGVPNNWVRLYDGGIEVNSTGKVDITAASEVNVTAPNCNVNGNLVVSTGATGSFTTTSGNIVTVQDGIVTNIA